MILMMCNYEIRRRNYKCGEFEAGTFTMYQLANLITNNSRKTINFAT